MIGLFYNLILVSFWIVDASPFLSKFTASGSPDVLNIHMVPHTHDDVGWRKTVHQYYEGTNNTIDNRGNVRNIITTVVESLLQDSSRTFVYVEVKFFSMWWYEQTDSMRDAVRYLIANQQLQFVNGGWCMHDEASTHYVSMIDQTTTGHDFLRDVLDVVPTIGWQLDPFGHSATHASLLSAYEYDALYFGRIDYQDLQLRQEGKQCEGLWAPNNNSETSIFWGLTGSYRGNYGAPDGFCFDILCDNTEQLVVNSTQERLLQRAETFLMDAVVQADQTADNHIMMTMGTDFNYQEAHRNFANMDLLISSIMEFQKFNLIDIPSMFGPHYRRVQIFYSTPEYYTRQKHKSALQHNHPLSKKPKQTSQDDFAWPWQTKTDDFFPYSDCPHCFWTGYFTSRTNFKRMERVASAFLLAARQIESWTSTTSPESSGRPICDCTGVLDCPCNRPLFPLEDSLGVAQHHDAVSGTGKQHVADDYSKILHHGIVLAADFVGKRLDELSASQTAASRPWTYCPLLHNESICETSVVSSYNGVEVLVYNSLPQAHSSVVRLPVPKLGTYQIQDYTASANESATTVESFGAPLVDLRDDPNYVVAWETGLIPAMGFKTFRVQQLHRKYAQQDYDDKSFAFQRTLGALTTGIRKISNDFFTVTADESTGLIKEVATNDTNIPFYQSWGYYTSFDSTYDQSEVQPSWSTSQNSGAYIFRPSKPAQKPIPLEAVSATFVNTSVGMEIHTTFSESWIRQIVRIGSGKPYIEVEYTIGPVPIDDDRGKEIVVKFGSPVLRSESVFFTDSNGREFQRRVRNERPSWNLDVFEPVAGNYYPVNAAMFIEDSSNSLAVIVDRSQGGASLRDGEIELMVQRRTVADDARGVDEPLNETCGGMTPYPPYGNAERVGQGIITRGTHRLLVGPGHSGAALARSAMDPAFAQPIVFVRPCDNQTQATDSTPSFSGLRMDLPSNIFIPTLTRVSSSNETTLLLRIGHQYAGGESETYSATSSVNISHIFRPFQVQSITEMSLTGNQKLKDLRKRKLLWSTTPPNLQGIHDGVVELEAMQVRTFLITCK